MPTSTAADAVVLAVVAGTLESITREMSDTVSRTARTPIAKRAHDFSNCIFDWRARMVVNGEYDLPNHIGSAIFTAKAALNALGPPDPGDLIYHNDPAMGGNHIPDMTLFRPVHVDGEFLFLAGCKMHMLDVGGMTSGGYHPQATEIFQEGIRIPPVKLQEKGRFRDDVLRMILANVRYPDLFEADFKAQVAATLVAERRLTELVGKYGVDQVRAATEALLKIPANNMADFIAGLPDGTYSGSSRIESDGRGNGPLTVGAQIEVRGDRASVRISSPPQVDSYINCYEANTHSMVYLAFLSYAGLGLPINEGAYDNIEVDCGPPGTLLNARLPAATSMSTSIANQHTLEAMQVALASAAPDRARAGWSMVPLTIISGNWPRSGERYTAHFMLSIMGGGGAVAGMDGWSALGPGSSAGAIRAGNVEDIEQEYPVLVSRCEFRADSGGPGRWRGGLALDFQFKAVDHDIDVVATGVGDAFAPASLGQRDTPADEAQLNRRYAIAPDGTTSRIVPYSIEHVGDGQVVLCSPQGGGGIGDPFERPIEDVRRDVRNGLVSVAAAARHYGVALREGDLALDSAGTAALRARRADRGDAAATTTASAPEPEE